MVSLEAHTVFASADIPPDSVIWMGDFNYRIGLNVDKVKQLIKVGDLETLYENDQVSFLLYIGGQNLTLSS